MGWDPILYKHISMMCKARYFGFKQNHRLGTNLRVSLLLSFAKFRREKSAQRQLANPWQTLRVSQKIKGIGNWLSGKQSCISAAL
eukprot:3294260-Heterocapsa_arctica.AAC.1